MITVQTNGLPVFIIAPQSVADLRALQTVIEHGAESVDEDEEFNDGSGQRTAPQEFISQLREQVCR